ncbi:MAG TPA: hypothetical protein VF695_10530 [Sphingomonas sp.]
MNPAMRQTPLLVAQPTRFAGLPRPIARVVLAAVALLILASLLAIGSPVSGGPATAPGEAPLTDLALYTGIVDAIRHGDGYYQAAADALRAGGYPLRPFVTFRLPTLAVIQATLPGPILVLLQWALVAAVLFAWWHRVAPALTRPPAKVGALLLLAGGTVAGWQYALAPFHELWAGLFIALSLALRTRERWTEAVAFALAAALIRETALLYLLVMAAIALIEGRRREASGWAAAIGAFAIAVLAHAYAVDQVVRSLDPASPGWSGLLGPGFVGSALATSTAMTALPVAVAAPLIALSLVGWVAWRDESGIRVAATWLAYALLLSVAARAENFYWALLIAPVSLAGLIFVPNALRDLIAAALDRRRITVRRVVR